MEKKMMTKKKKAAEKEEQEAKGRREDEAENQATFLLKYFLVLTHSQYGKKCCGTCRCFIRRQVITKVRDPAL
jgi:hypothetical protein